MAVGRSSPGQSISAPMSAQGNLIRTGSTLGHEQWETSAATSLSQEGTGTISSRAELDQADVGEFQLEVSNSNGAWSSSST